MKRIITASVWLALLASSALGQSYTRWVVGDTADATPSNYQGGLVLAGGGPDNDEAMRWMLQRAAGGDVVVLRASGTNGYNAYFYTELGVPVNSVETIRFNSAEAAHDPYVLRQIRNAELVFIAGGDQYRYYQYWKDTPVEEALNYLLREKKITVGGTSAGMAILTSAYYAPSVASLTSAQALANPFHPNFDVLGWADFLQPPFVARAISDSHYDQRERAGRHFAFLARLTEAHSEPFYGIACNEYTAVCVDTSGRAIVFGDYPSYNDYAYFLKTNCQQPFGPEVIQPNVPLTWNRQQAAVIAYVVPGTKMGSHSFDLKTWETGSGGQWQHWYAVQGVFVQQGAPHGACAPASSSQERSSERPCVRTYPNPARERLLVELEEPANAVLMLFDVIGRQVGLYHSEATHHVVATGHLPPGHYVLIVQTSRSSCRTPIFLK